MKRIALFTSCLVLAVTAASTPPTGAAAEESRPDTADAVVVQHCLIGYKRSIPGQKLARTKAEARALAEDLFRRAREGEDFDGLVREHTDDRYPGILNVTDRGAPVRAGYRTRDELVPGFGDLAFELEVGDIGLVPWHAYRSPYGWHIIKRLE